MSGARTARRDLLLPVAVLTMVALVSICAYHWILGLGLLGLDTYPMILTSRIQNGHDLLGTFTEELMAGRYVGGQFYRPVVNFSFALDYAIWGLEPKGYHLTDLAILLANALLLGAVVRRLLGSHFPAAPLVAALIFVLHPAQLEVLPVSARRADTLCLLFMLACLLAQPRPGQGSPGLRGGVAGGILALLAVASKGTGIILVPLVFVLHFLSHHESSSSRRIRESLLATLPVVVAALLFSVGRTLVLGGLGGHASSSLANVFYFPRLIEPYLALVLFPQVPLASRAWIVVVSLCLILIVTLVWRHSGTTGADESSGLRSGLVFLSCWLLAVLCVSALSGRLEAWYAMLFVPPYAILLGILVDTGVRAARERRYLLALPILGVSLWLSGSHVRYSALVYEYSRWQRASEVAAGFLDRFEEHVRSADPGASIEIDGFAEALAPATRSPGVRSAVILSDYSVQAWAELAMPDRPVEVYLIRPSGRPGAPRDETTVRVRLVPGVKPTGSRPR